MILEDSSQHFCLVDFMGFVFAISTNPNKHSFFVSLRIKSFITKNKRKKERKKRKEYIT